MFRRLVPIAAIWLALVPSATAARAAGNQAGRAPAQTAKPPADAVLKARAESALAAAADLRGRTLMADARAGTVTVTGKVATTSELQTVGAVVRAVPGVKEVRFSVQVEPPPAAGRGAGRGVPDGRGASAPQPGDR
jgi:osmotically-inducible protein OsmY